MSDEHRYVAEVSLPVSVDQAFAYHDRPGALDRLIPPWESARIERSDRSLDPGSEVELVTKIAGIPVRWVAQHTQYDPPHLFEDVQLSGPFASWLHRHEFQSTGEHSSQMRDEIRYRMPMGPVGNALGHAKARATIESMFAYRHRTTSDDLKLLAKESADAHNAKPLTVAISGSNGLVGSRLQTLLSLLGHQTRDIVRGDAKNIDDVAVWSEGDDYRKLGGVDAVVHLAGKPIADDRWTEEVRREIRDSRVKKTRELCEKLARLDHKPRVLVCASATGFYGDRGDEVLSESSCAGEGFLPDVCQEWEQSCQAAVDAGIRVVHARFGIVLTPAGGALAKMLTPAKLFGGSLGSGKQWWSWIAIDDVLGAIHHSIIDPAVQGPVNFVSPTPVTNREFAKTLADVLGRAAVFPAPAFGLRLALGEMADALLLASARVEPQRLNETGYEFRFTNLQDTLRHYLGRHRCASVA
tara:strand:+ start:25041 stop:26444 length:1404 start_codon:yes stop_codon:yes gene_type:complete